MKYPDRRNEDYLRLLKPEQLYRVKFNGFVLFHVLAWMIPRRSYLLLTEDFAQIINWTHHVKDLVNSLTLESK